MRSSLLLTGAASSLVAFGCAVPSNDLPDAGTTSQAATAVVLVERVTGPGDATRESLVARFVRARQGTVDEQALRMAGVAYDLPALGACATPPDDLAALQPRAVDLLDVGPLTAEAPQGDTLLLPRALPDPAGVVSGVFYSSPRASDVFEAGQGLSLRAAGGPDLDPFAVQVAAPPDLELVEVTSTDAGLDVVWEVAEPDPRDVVYLEVLAPSPRVVLRCASADAGRFVVPSSALAGVVAGQLAVHRLRREPFSAKGVEPGEVRFDLARVVLFER
jgi:hypothetical protein